MLGIPVKCKDNSDSDNIFKAFYGTISCNPLIKAIVYYSINYVIFKSEYAFIYSFLFSSFTII